jgi:hypothetical protein
MFYVYQEKPELTAVMLEVAVLYRLTQSSQISQRDSLLHVLIAQAIEVELDVSHMS